MNKNNLFALVINIAGAFSWYWLGYLNGKKKKCNETYVINNFDSTFKEKK